MSNSKKIIALIAALVFFVSLAVGYWPVYHKGHPWSFAADAMILARNLNLVGNYSLDSEKNIVLSSELIAVEGIPSDLGNKLTPVLTSYFFRVFGFTPLLPLWISLGVFAVINVLLFLLVRRRFGFLAGILFALTAVLSPFMLQNAARFGTYEWAMLFLTIALVVYFWREKPPLANLLIAGIFLGLATLARNSFLVLPLAFALYELWQNHSWKKALTLVLPLVVFWGIYLGPGLLNGQSIHNAYLSGPEEKTTAYMHIFPDPYTWHFERDAYAQTLIGSGDYGVNEFLLKYGYPVSPQNKITMYLASAWSYPWGFLSVKNTGGPLVLFLLALGIFYLSQKNKKVLWLFVCWAGSLYVFLIISTGNHFGHMMPLQFPFFLLTALGLLTLFDFVRQSEFSARAKTMLVFGLLAVFIGHLIWADQEMFHEKYLYAQTGQSYATINLVKQAADKLDKKTDVLAVGSPNPTTSMVNYYTNFSCVYFAPATVQKLIRENKLAWAFAQFGITRVVGYDAELGRDISAATGIGPL